MTNSNALSRYHARYNNDTYRAIQTALIADLYGEDKANDLATREQLLGEDNPNILMNLVIDVAIEMSATPALSSQVHLLVDLVVHLQLSPETIRLIQQHLANFEQSGGTISVDFENAALTRLKLSGIRDRLLDSVTTSNAIHGGHGRAAHYLLKSAEALLQTAELLLKHENSEGYLQEKLIHGTSALADAEREIEILFSDA